MFLHFWAQFPRFSQKGIWMFKVLTSVYYVTVISGLMPNPLSFLLLHHPSLKIVFILLSLPKWKQILMSFACAPDDSLGGSVIVQAAKMPTRTDREPIPINATRQPCDQSGQV